ncbi:MAG: class I SAM-dependent methyltransferase, partial [Promethearchaeota archaeon]
MTRKKKLPRFPIDYIGDKAIEYNTLDWMERNQKQTTQKCIEFLYDEQLGHIEKNKNENQIIVDLGCGTGYSTEILIDYGFKVIGIELLEDMLLKALPIKYSLSGDKYRNLEVILADIRSLPFRSEKLNHGVSVSAYNFIIYDTTNY